VPIPARIRREGATFVRRCHIRNRFPVSLRLPLNWPQTISERGSMRPAHQRLTFIMVLLLASAIGRSAHAVGEQNGRLAGRVTEAQTGAPVPGATITVRGRSLIGGPQSQVTDEDGNYEFTELPPGPYTVEVAFAGVKPVVRRVVVLQGQTV